MAPERSGEKSIVFYDIASAPPKRTYAPNPWKARLALNFKSASYSTAWVELPDVASTRTALGVPPSRKFPDGSDFHTLPLLHDKMTNQYVGDSFDIALYLDDKYPDGPRLIAQGMAGVTKAWNDRIDQLFTRFVKLCVDGMPLNPDNADICRQTFASRGRLMGWDGDWTVKGDERGDMLAEFQAALGELEIYYSYTIDMQRRAESSGPFLSGEQPTYADLIVGGWLGYVHETLPPAELAGFQTWHNGRWGRIWRALAKYADSTK
ncbi:hypothetical protein HRG_005213 [Hirsutella rhossiliensis]|uniref:GST N-terminal domain-containing protein n=1 Tax=Hirsutella rhossiliensis TaxID=111463 RepID=A0A9P8SH40_9HYPO|nr:uncharacterized protein HRG_05213 [Hirsutella rhossiliensis]KAH0962703.1 hypothetical protein HRG_05213 [Hirsutella rhossiliensis]